jgi:NADH-quinone oxidoreductase subunit A
MLAGYVPILVIIAIGVGLGILLTLTSMYLGPHRPTTAKLMPYECGIIPTTQARQRFPVKFYLMAMLFIVFDIEAIFLYPWAVQLRALGRFGLVEMFSFIAVVFVGLLYVWRKGALDWD